MEITISIPIDNWIDNIIRTLIIKRSYEGYLIYNIVMDDPDKDTKPLSYDEYKNFEYWKIIISFKFYISKYQGFSKTTALNAMNPTRKTLLKYALSPKKLYKYYK